MSNNILRSCWKGRNVLLAVTGSIAAYKSAHLTRLFIKLGANVKVVQTPSSKDFVTPLTLSTLSKNPVLSDFTYLKKGQPYWNNHVDLGLWADCMIIAPATANTLSKMVTGNCDNLVLATYLSATCPVFIAPAMDFDMYKHPSTKANIVKLQEYGNHCMAANDGELASGLSGIGRMAEPEEIIAYVEHKLFSDLPLKGKKIMVTAGPTHEAVDPVRFIGNHSSGKMGFAIAHSAAKRGADVILISGPTNLSVNDSKIELINVTSAQEMLEACQNTYNSCQLTIMAAAVSDFRPKSVAAQKLKKSTQSRQIELEPTNDILEMLGQHKKSGQFLCGFALETENEELNALKKLKKKNLDMIVLNSLRDCGAGFQHDTNKITIIDKNNKTHKFELKSKDQVADDIIDFILTQF